MEDSGIRSRKTGHKKESPIPIRSRCKAATDWTPKSIGRTDAEAEAPILWPPDMKSSLEKTLMLGKIEGGRRRG